MIKTISKRLLVLIALSVCLTAKSQPAIPMEWFDFPSGPPGAFATSWGSLPMAYTTNLISAAVPLDVNWWTPNALFLDTTNLSSAYVQYYVIDSNFVQNISYSAPASILLYYSPNWQSVSLGGSGAGQTAFLIAGGDWSPGSPNGLFCIYIDSTGSNLCFGGVSNGVSSTFVSTPIAWASNSWHQIGIEWSDRQGFKPGSSAIYLDGSLSATGTAVSIVPQLSTDTNSFYTNGFFVGSDSSGFEQCRGAIWSLVTWSVRYGAWYTNSWAGLSNDLASWQASPGGGFGGMMGAPAGPGYIPGFTYNTNYAEYYNYWLTANMASNGTQVAVTLQDTLSNLTYNILTNSTMDPTPDDWGVWQTITATNSVIVAPPFTVGTNATFFQAAMVWNSSPASDLLPDWLSMLYFNALVPKNYGYITNGLVAYWRMNEASGSTAHDSGGNGLDLSLVGSPSWGSNYLILNGTNQYGLIASSGFTNADTNDMTICAWVNKTGSSQKGIVNKFYTDSVTYGGWSFQVLPDGALDMYVEHGEDVSNTGPRTVTLGQWTFVTVVWHYSTNNIHADFYFNGVFDSSTNNSAAIQNSSGSSPLQVGSVSGSYDFDGLMHDVAIYHRALSSSEIAVNFLVSAFNTNVPNPDLLYYKMTEYGQATPPVRLTDSSTHGGTTGTVWDTNNGVLSLPLWTNKPGGATNSALHFHGVVTHIDTGNTNLFNFTNNPFTINFWLRPDNEGSYYIGNDTYGTSGWYLCGVPTTSGLIFGTEANGVDHALRATNGVAGWPSTSWNMVTITYDGNNTPLIYVNGSLVATTGSFANPAPSSNSLIFGLGTDASGSDDLDGDIWLPQIWSTVLSPMEIANLYCNQLFGIPWP